MIRSLSLAFSLLFAATAPAQNTWYVDIEGTAPGSGTRLDPYTSIQFAIDASTTSSGDVVLVLPGVYVESLDFAGKALRLESTAGSGRTTIDADNFGSCVTVAGSSDLSVVRGFTLRNGFATFGGGLLCSDASVDLEACAVTANVASSGGGVHAEDGSVVSISGCSITNNVSNGFAEDCLGGGLCVVESTVTVEDSAIENNAGPRGSGVGLVESVATFRNCDLLTNIFGPPEGEGGGLHADESDVTLLDSRIVGNRAFRGGGAAILYDSILTVARCEFADNASLGSFWGGALLFPADRPGTATIRRSTFSGNVSGGGGAAYVGAGTTTFTGCVFSDNDVRGQSFFEQGNGGALLVEPRANVVARHCIFSDNRARGDANGNPGRGGAVFGPASLERCTVAHNLADDNASTGTPAEGAGVFGATLRDSIVWRNVPDGVAGPAVATYSDVQGGWPGTGNIVAIPQFLDGPQRNYHLQFGSPCIDAGDPASPLDPDGSRADMGALAFADCNGNEVLDADDILMGTSQDANENGIPDECECGIANTCLSAPNSVGPGCVLSADGTPGATGFALVASGAPAGKFGLFYYGTEPIQAPFGDGFRCAGGDIERLRPTVIDGAGTARTVFPKTTAIGLGDTRYFQFFYRDRQGPGGSGINLSDALRVTFCE